MLTEKELGERLKNIREVRRISQFRLGEMVECGQGHIGKLEKGEHYPKHYDFCIGGGEWDADGLWKPNEKGLGYGRVLDYIGVRY